MPVVYASELPSVIERLVAAPKLAIDTETTGLRPYQGDRLFSVIVADAEDSFYFNFNEHDPTGRRYSLPRADLIGGMAPLWGSERLWFLFNAKFDMHMLAQEGVYLRGEIHDCMVGARLELNNRLRLGMEFVAKDIGFSKSKTVEDYIKKNKLKREVIDPWGERTLEPEFHKVPLSVIAPYGMQDARVTFALGQHQEAKLETMSQEASDKHRPIRELWTMEKNLTQVCFAMEARGIRVNKKYCQEAFAFEEERARAAAAEFERLCGIGFKDSNGVLAQAFTQAGCEYPTTEKGNPSFTDAVLTGLKNPLAEALRTYRDASKRAGTYYKNFLRYADDNGAVHANMRQAGTETGRFSYSDPNLQNLSKEEDLSEKYLIRRSFVPRPDHCFVMLDYSQMEYRMMLDYAGEMELIEQVKNGMDIHEATAQMMGVSRREAKTLNFMLLYGGGAQKLADALGLSLEEAQKLKALYFDKLPKVRSFIRKCVKVAEQRGYIVAWSGRVLRYPDSDFAYKAPNGLIQGGCADVVKHAMVECHSFLAHYKSKMLVQVHDELLFEMHKDELALVPRLQGIMEGAYPYKHLPMEVGVDHSWVSWADKVEGLPNGNDDRGAQVCQM